MDTACRWLKADLALAAETVLCLSLFGPQPLAWAYLVESALSREAGAGTRLVLVLAATVVGTVVTLFAARRAEEARARALAKAGRGVQADVLTILVVVLAGSLAATAFAWFLFGGGYAPGR